MTHYIKLNHYTFYKIENDELFHYTGSMYDYNKYNHKNEEEKWYWEKVYFSKIRQNKTDDWVYVEDLTELKVWQYNKLVAEISKVDKTYAIDYLGGRFID